MHSIPAVIKEGLTEIEAMRIVTGANTTWRKDGLRRVQRFIVYLYFILDLL